MTVPMKPIALLAFGLAIAGTAAITFAQNPPQGGQPGARHAKIDANGDGVIDRSEAAKAPRLAENFDKLDANKDGRLSADERPQRGGRHGGKGGRNGGMAKLDTNGDGAIDRAEAAKAPRLAERFDQLDKNKDGRIGADERPQHGGRRGGREDGPGGRGGERMVQLDKNGDGRFSREELAGHERALQNFTAIDGNKDGFLTREEMKTYHQAHRGEGRPQPKP